MSEQPVVIVTGASRGLGAATARVLGGLGAVVILTARGENGLDEVERDITQAGGIAYCHLCDVSSMNDCRLLIQDTVQRFGNIDALVNNAGVIRPIASIGQGDPRVWEQNILINLVGPYFLTYYALPYLRGRMGRIINVSSGSAVSVDEGWSAYSVAKAGLNHFTRILAAEEPAITAITFRPGKMDTAMQATIRAEGKDGMPEARYAQFVRHFEQGELASPEQVGLALAVLALYAPRAWNGEFIRLGEERLQMLIAHPNG
jgi:NAD(P)-dependent dehydrogenase (short-subunit alcohol dehydrogenase family)